MNTSSPFVITIGRQLGSGGREIARLLAERFNIAVYDKEILSLAAEEAGLAKRIFERSDERKGFFRSLMNVMQPFVGGGGDFYSNQLSDEHLFTLQSRVIQRVAGERSCIFIGRVADYVLRNHPRHCSIFIAADTPSRIDRLTRHLEINPKQALEKIGENDEQRATYYNFYSSGTWGAADTYDLCINSSILGLERTAEFIANFVAAKLQLSAEEFPAQSTQSDLPTNPASTNSGVSASASAKSPTQKNAAEAASSATPTPSATPHEG